MGPTRLLLRAQPPPPAFRLSRHSTPAGMHEAARELAVCTQREGRLEMDCVLLRERTAAADARHAAAEAENARLLQKLEAGASPGRLAAEQAAAAAEAQVQALRGRLREAERQAAGMDGEVQRRREAAQVQAEALRELQVGKCWKRAVLRAWRCSAVIKLTHWAAAVGRMPAAPATHAASFTQHLPTPATHPCRPQTARSAAHGAPPTPGERPWGGLRRRRSAARWRWLLPWWRSARRASWLSRWVGVWRGGSEVGNGATEQSLRRAVLVHASQPTHHCTTRAS